MTKPPAVVVRSTKPVGELQLHRLGQRVRIYCVLCRRNKTHDMVATTNGDWGQTVCVGCYGTHVHTQREEANRTVVKKRLGRRLPGLHDLLAFFRVAGVDAELIPGECLRINGSQTRPITHLPPSNTLEWHSIVDEIAFRYVGGKFIRVIEDNARFGEGLRALLRHREQGFVIMRGDVRLAVIQATRAQIPHHEVIYANFLLAGPHWQQVADILCAAEPELVAEWKREQDSKVAAEEAAAAPAAERRRVAARRRIVQFPDDLAPELIDDCLDASRRIRLERQVAYERPVVLECDVGELTLLPIVGTEARLLMPFRLHNGMDRLQGELVLGDRDPLALLIGADVADEDAITAWTCALLGFADATCIELEPVESTVRRASAGRRRPASLAWHDRPAPRTLPRRQPWPKYLEPIGHWVRYSGSFVAGHRRHLNVGQTASDEALDRARQVGITLRPHETWVRPHARGVPDDIEMRFRWHTSPALRRYRT